MVELLSPAAMEARVILIAEMCGKALHAASVRSCMEMVYDVPEMTYIRTMALLDSHTLDSDGGLTQIVTVDQDYPVEDFDSHVGKETVGDYAAYVHNGYTQWVYGFDTGDFHVGKFWFDEAVRFAYPTLLAYVRVAFMECIREVMLEITR